LGSFVRKRGTLKAKTARGGKGTTDLKTQGGDARGLPLHQGGEKGDKEKKGKESGAASSRKKTGKGSVGENMR